MRRYGAGRFAAALPLRSARRLRRRSRSARFAALRLRRSRSRPAFRFGWRSRSRPAFRFGWRSRSARFAALRLRRSRSHSVRHVAAALSLRPARRVAVAALPLRSGGFYLINIYLNIIINQSRRRREAPAFRTAKKYAPSGGVFPLSDIYFCFAYSAIALYFSKSSGRRMRALAGLVEGSSMHGMQPQGSQNRL